MKCTRCGKEFEGRFCPECGAPAMQQNPMPQVVMNNAAPKKKKGSCLVTVGIIVGVFFVIGLGGALVEVRKQTQEIEKIETTETPENKIEDQESAKEEEKTEEITTFSPGETARYNNVKVKMTGVAESSGSTYNKPSEGNVFVLAEFEIENDSKEELNISSLMSFDAYQDGYSTSLSLQSLLENPGQQLDGSIAPGKKMKGCVGYEVPADYKELEINVQLSVWSNQKITFIYTKE